MTCATSGGQLTQITLATHNVMQTNVGEKDNDSLEANFKKQLSLHRYLIIINLLVIQGIKD